MVSIFNLSKYFRNSTAKEQLFKKLLILVLFQLNLKKTTAKYVEKF